ncbi:MAG: glycosyltransferase family 2 protein [Planctomycetota bacterium]|nr:glycosyltransferase family 2 protein [Planctomycetota bacterium]
MELIKVAEILLVFIVLPTAVFYLVARHSPFALAVCYHVIISLFIFQASLSYLQSFGALARRRFKELPTAKHQPVPKTTFIISAYLPNEVEVVEETLLNVLQKVERPASGIEVILAYNTPEMVEIETRLKELAYKWPELILANAHGSKSKSENLNYVLELASGGMIVLLDADHIVRPDCLFRAWRWLDEGYDVVQGRCRIRNGHESAISALVEVEFEIIYGISHYAKSLMFDAALFGGANGYWKAPVLKAVKFHPEMLTEDIDATLRTVLSGHRIVHDRSIVSEELAPSTLSRWWHQRKRWAQGWFQCSIKHQWGVLASKFLKFRQKFYWTLLLFWRIFYDVASQFLFPIVFAYWLHKGAVEFPMTPFIWFAIFYTMLSGPVEALAAYKDAVRPIPSLLRYPYYAVVAFPYTLAKNLLQLVSVRDELFGEREWIISARSTKQ